MGIRIRIQMMPDLFLSFETTKVNIFYTNVDVWIVIFLIGVWFSYLQVRPSFFGGFLVSLFNFIKLKIIRKGPVPLLGEVSFPSVAGVLFLNFLA